MFKCYDLAQAHYRVFANNEASRHLIQVVIDPTKEQDDRERCLATLLRSAHTSGKVIGQMDANVSWAKHQGN